VLALFMWAPWRTAAEPAKAVRFQITPPPAVKIGSSFSLSPDGTKLAYVGSGVDGVPRLLVRAMDSLESRALAGTEHVGWPFFWSPDSRFIAFGAGKLKKVDVAGGPPQILCGVQIVMGGSWNRDGVILFGTLDGTGIQRVSADGGASSPITVLNPARKEMNHTYPTFLPDGKHFLYLVQSSVPQNSGIYLGSLGSRPDGKESKRLLVADSGLGFVPFPEGKAGAIVFQRGGTLLAQRFDLRRLETADESVPVADQLSSNSTPLGSIGIFAVSQNGILAFRTASGGIKQLVWFDRQGKRVGTAGAPQSYGFMMRLSPDGTRVAATRVEAGNIDIWLSSFSSGIDTRFTFDPALDYDPAWSPDGKYVAFSSNRAGNMDLYRHASDGSGEDELLFKSDHRKIVTDWSRDGRFLLFHDGDPKTKRDLWVLTMDGSPGERKPVPVLRTEFDERDARFSPDGRWIAYMSDESGRDEIYVRPFPAHSTGGKWMISQGGGLLAAWRVDGKELFYVSNDGHIMAVPVSANGAGFQHGTPVALFKGPVSPQGWDVSADGKKFLLAVPVGETAQAPFTVVLNWLSLFKAK
jgi:Tol biopolymer transport system component